MSEHEHDQEKLVAWEAQKDDLKLLNSLGAEKFLSQEFPDLKHAFCHELTCVVCMDEGTAHKDVNGEGKFCLAGSGILLPADSEEKRLELAARLMIEHSITNITSHSGCGAAGLAYKRDFPSATLDAQAIEDYAVAWSKKLAEKINELQHEAEPSHITADEMVRPAEFHNARVVYFDGIGGFNPNKEIDLPMGFVIERKFVSADYAAAELSVAANIAFGGHGLGNLFTASEPFVVIAMASSEDEMNKLKNEAAEVLKDNENFKAGKIKIDGVVVR